MMFSSSSRNEKMAKKVLAAVALLFGLAAMLALAGCTTQGRHNLFLFFFDQEEQPEQPAVTTAQPTNVVAVVVPRSGLVPVAGGSTHVPFVKKECSKCHTSQTSQKLKQEMPELCFGTCHKNFLKDREQDEVHKPVFQGKCMKCHLPHQGPVTNLLKSAGLELCYTCHDDWTEGGKTVVHKPVVQGKCLSCHTSHVSEFKPLLHKEKKEICADCHKPYAKQFVHKPVVEGKCLTCHATHSSTFAGLVKRAGNAMCDACHEPDDMAKVPKHQGTESRQCAECHEMHDSNLAHLMKELAKVPP
jgi:predicted CXXCH cytochrome family protein